MVPDDRNRSPQDQVYPITAQLRQHLEQGHLLGTYGQYALDYIGEYEHGSVEIEELAPTRMRFYLSQDRGLDIDEMAKWLLEFASAVLVDYLMTVSVQEGEKK